MTTLTDGITTVVEATADQKGRSID